MIAKAIQFRAQPTSNGWWGVLASRMTGMLGWKRRLTLMALGGLAALALPPVGAVLVLLIALPGLVWMMGCARNRRAAFGAGWWWGLGWFSVGLYWIANALLLEPEKFGWMVPFATLGLSGLLACFCGAATWATYVTKQRGLARIVTLAGFWTLTEWVRSWILTGFPWNSIGSVWDAVPSVLQAASVVGVFGLSLLTMLLFGLPALLAESLPQGHKRRIALGCFLAFLVLSVSGSLRLARIPTETVPDLRLRLVQAALDQRIKGRSQYREQQLLDHVNLSRQSGWDHLSAVIWPETAAPYFLDQDGEHRALAATAAPSGGVLLTGAPRLTPIDVQPLQIWNSMIVIGADAQVQGVYDKAHLVPFGEYVPFRSILRIPKITLGGTDFSSGPGPVVMSLPGLPPVSPFICYEAIFPAAIVNRQEPRPEWMLTLTNDGWFGMSAGPYQHLAAGRMRAVEEGLPLVRAANTGISAIIDPLGRITAQLDLGQKGIVDGALPRPVPPTLFSLYGNAIPVGLAVICIVLGLGLSRIRQKTNAMW